MIQKRVEECVGMVLAHDHTRIVPGKEKGVAFRKGHVLCEADVAILKDMGKNHLYVYSLADGHMHEEEGALRLAKAVAGDNLVLSESKEGKVELSSNLAGMLHIETELLDLVNSSEGLILATRHSGTVLVPGDVVAGAKIIPLVIDASIIHELEKKLTARSVVSVLPFHPLKVGIVVTGTEVFEGRIKDAFAPVLKAKVEAFGATVIATSFAPDDKERIKTELNSLLERGCECILTSGGMSVDPDDLTPQALTELASDVVSYGSPVLPGAMFMMAYKDELPLMGVPACGMFNKTTVLDLVLPYVFAKVRVTKKLMLSFAHGGLCLKCEQCRYPHCEFGK